MPHVKVEQGAGRHATDLAGMDSEVASALDLPRECQQYNDSHVLRPRQRPDSARLHETVPISSLLRAQPDTATRVHPVFARLEQNGGARRASSKD